MRSAAACSAILLAAALGTASSAQPQMAPTPPRPWLVAHRGASAIAPENTVPAFARAAELGATFVEFDLQRTKDGAIVCLHDPTLERTTDVEEVFPDRAQVDGTGVKRWPLADFTLDEIRRLDAGTWFAPAFRGTRVPTFAETIASLRGRAGLFIELKLPERYPGIERAILDELARAGLATPGADPKTPVLLQSFTAASVETLTRELKTPLPVHFLLGLRDAPTWLSPEGVAKIRGFATGLSPEKAILLAPQHAAALKALHDAGFPITPYTFRASNVAGFPDVRAEMAHYLDVLKVDGVITDNPDQMPAARR